MGVIKLDNKNFKQEVLNSDKTVIVDFYADWCGPCKMMSPIVDEISQELSDKVKVCKLNVDENQDLAIEYDVMSIPTLIFFKKGKSTNVLVGLRDKDEILKNIQ